MHVEWKDLHSLMYQWRHMAVVAPINMIVWAALVCSRAVFVCVYMLVSLRWTYVRVWYVSSPTSRGDTLKPFVDPCHSIVMNVSPRSILSSFRSVWIKLIFYIEMFSVVGYVLNVFSMSSFYFLAERSIFCR
jgi:hypothetical protein